MNISLPFDREAWKFSGILAIISIVLGSVSTNAGWLCSILTVCCLLFFRDPDRVHPVGDSFVTSPADGIVLKISELEPPGELNLEGRWRKISIFMSIFNVHVNRTPVSGQVTDIQYVPGKFFNVTLDKANEYNERQATHMIMRDGTKVVFVQIAGLIARRIRCDIEVGQELTIGDRVGMIRFGSRVDVYLPTDVKILVEEGQITVAGETILADMSSKTKN